MVRQSEKGWAAITRYTGASVRELRDAIDAGELRCRPPRIDRACLDQWLRLRALRLRLPKVG